MQMEEIPLTLAMPGREVIAGRGFTAGAALPLLDSLAEDSWFATAQAIAADPLAREVRLGLVVVRRHHGSWEALVSGDGTVLHHAPVPPEAVAPGRLLADLRRLALASGTALVGGTDGRPFAVELAGWLHEPALAPLRRAVVLVYRLRAPDDLPAPDGASWVSAGRLAHIPLDPVSALALDAVPR
jgi:hypothetical protein